MSVHVTDHALCRYLERVMGIDVEAVRRKCAETPGLAAAVALGARSYSHDGCTYRLQEGGFLVTIEPNQTPATAHRKAQQKRGQTTRARDGGGVNHHYRGGSSAKRSPRPEQAPEMEPAE